MDSGSSPQKARATLSKRLEKSIGQLIKETVVTCRCDANYTNIKAKCYKCGKRCTVIWDFTRWVGDDGKLRIHVAGICCFDWSSRGKREGWMGTTSRVFAQWLFERAMSQEDIILVECTRTFKPTILQDVLGETHSIHATIFSPLQMGMGVNRHRIYIVCLRKAKLRWAAPMDLAGTVKALFFRHNVLHGSQYFRAPQEDIDKDVATLALKRGIDSEHEGIKLQHKHLIGAGYRLREQGYLRMVMESDKQLHDDDFDFIVDISQYCNISGFTRHIPALARKGEPHSLTLRRPMLKGERCEAMGLPYYASAEVPFVNPIAHLVKRTGGWPAKFGNSMHSAAIGGVLMIALGCTVMV